MVWVGQEVSNYRTPAYPVFLLSSLGWIVRSLLYKNVSYIKFILNMMNQSVNVFNFSPDLMLGTPTIQY